MGVIVSVSRRTDIPAFFSEWFFRRLDEGYAFSVNPYNPKQKKSVSLDPEDLDGIVFWTRDVGPMLNKLKRLENIAFYFNVTLTPYDSDIEKVFYDKKRTLDSIKGLCGQIGPDRVIWRYDPVFFNDVYDMGFHKNRFGQFARELEGCVKTCIISFVDEYSFSSKRMQKAGIHPADIEKMCDAAKYFSEAAGSFGIKVKSCSEPVLSELTEIEAAACIDSDLLGRISGKTIEYKKDPNQRKACRCALSVDIGAYDTCPGGCVYCYANRSEKTMLKNNSMYDLNSPAFCRDLKE